MAGCLFLTTIFLLASSAHAASLCPRDLHEVLDSPVCGDYRLRMITAWRTTIDSTNAGDACVDALRVLLTSAASMPCTASLATTGRTHARRLSGSDGRYRCTFDETAPLDVNDLTQSFIMDCEELDKPYNYVWVMYVGVYGGLASLCCLYALVNCCISSIKRRINAHRERQGQEAVDKEEAPSEGHPYVEVELPEHESRV